MYVPVKAPIVSKVGGVDAVFIDKHFVGTLQPWMSKCRVNVHSLIPFIDEQFGDKVSTFDAHVAPPGVLKGPPSWNI